MKVLRVVDLCKDYPSFSLKNVSFDMEEGRIMGFIGRNGAGKSTTLKSLMNLVHKKSGTIQFFGLDYADNELEIKQRIGFLGGGIDYYLNKKLSVITQVTKRFYSQWDDSIYNRFIRLFDLDLNKTPKELSAGMKVKFGLAQALSHNAQLLLLDEPTSGLDPVSRDELLEIFLNLADEGKSILFSTHITSDLDKCADDITYIKNGSIIESGDLKEFVSGYRVVWLKEKIFDSRIIGIKRAKNGFTGLVRAKDSESFAEAKPADLEEIMIHMEKEGQTDEESID